MAAAQLTVPTDDRVSQHEVLVTPFAVVEPQPPRRAEPLDLRGQALGRCWGA